MPLDSSNYRVTAIGFHSGPLCCQPNGIQLVVVGRCEFMRGSYLLPLLVPVLRAHLHACGLVALAAVGRHAQIDGRGAVRTGFGCAVNEFNVNPRHDAVMLCANPVRP